MENKNLFQNIALQQFNQSNAIAYNKYFTSKVSDYNFQLLDNAYRSAGKTYAKLKIAIETNNCVSKDCSLELAGIKNLEEAPRTSLNFIASIIAEFNVTEEPNFDPNNNYAYTAANSLMTSKPGFSKTDGYSAYLDLLPDGSQQISFMGPAFEAPLVINNTALDALLESGTSLVVSTPDINKDMLRLLVETGIFPPDSIGENQQLSSAAKISEEFILKFNGEPDYEIIDIGNGKGRNVYRYDIDKIDKKVAPFMNAEIAGVLGAEQEAVAAWNVFLSKGTSVEEDDQMVQNANAGMAVMVL